MTAREIVLPADMDPAEAWRKGWEAALVEVGAMLEIAAAMWPASAVDLLSFGDVLRVEMPPPPVRTADGLEERGA